MRTSCTSPRPWRPSRLGAALARVLLAAVAWQLGPCAVLAATPTQATFIEVLFGDLPPSPGDDANGDGALTVADLLLLPPGDSTTPTPGPTRTVTTTPPPGATATLPASPTATRTATPSPTHTDTPAPTATATLTATPAPPPPPPNRDARGLAVRRHDFRPPAARGGRPTRVSRHRPQREKDDGNDDRSQLGTRREIRHRRQGDERQPGAQARDAILHRHGQRTLLHRRHLPAEWYRRLADVRAGAVAPGDASDRRPDTVQQQPLRCATDQRRGQGRVRRPHGHVHAGVRAPERHGSRRHVYAGRAFHRHHQPERRRRDQRSGPRPRGRGRSASCPPSVARRRGWS